MSNRITPLKNILFYFICFIFVACFSNNVNAQGWEHTYLPDTLSNGYNYSQMAITPDDGYLIAGVGGDPTSFGGQVVLIKTDVDGVEQWRKVHTPPIQLFGYITELIPLNNGNYILIGEVENNELIPVIMVFDINGDLVWELVLPTPPGSGALRLVQTQDDHIVLLGHEIISPDLLVHLTKIDLDGNILWSKFPGLDADAQDLIELANGNLVITGQLDPDNQVSVSVLTPDGDVIQNYVYDYVHLTGESIRSTTDGGFIIGANNGFVPNDNSEINLIKIDQNFEEEWMVGFDLEYNDDQRARITKIEQTIDGGYAIMGRFISGPPNNSFILKTDALGQQEWYREYQEGNTNWTYLYDWEYLGEDGFVMQGKISDAANFFSGGFYLIKTDSQGLLHKNFLQGQAYIDTNENCMLDSTEQLADLWQLNILNNSFNNTYTISDGNFDVSLEEGNYTANLLPYNEVWEACPEDFDFDLSGVYDTVQMNFGATGIVDCPVLGVDVTGGFQRFCNPNNLYVQYCNSGSIPATDAYIEIEFHPYYEVLNAGVPYTNVDNLYTFDLGTVDVFECETFLLETFLSCDGLIGESVCLEAHIYPDSLCLTPSPNWSGASIEVEAYCENDTVTYRLQNVGVGNMSAPLEYEIIVEDVILFQEPFDLDANQIIIEKFPTAAGETVRVQAMQEPGHPGFSMPSDAVEGCGGDIHAGFIDLFPHNDADGFVDIFCKKVIGPNDPNDNIGSPFGYGEEHFIEVDQPIEYTIRFQNIGTDTAFNVVIRDTISEFLDIASMIPGASSHDYQFEIGPNRVAKFTYANIMLPDSTVNEAASHGVVTFSIRQQPNNPIGSVINNKAAIYFDYNAPVITNETWHTIGADFIEIDIDTTVIISTQEIAQQDTYIYPNPFSAKVQFEVSEQFTGPFQLLIRDVHGKLVDEVQDIASNEFTYHSKLSAGIYFYSISSSDEECGVGKMVVVPEKK